MPRYDRIALILSLAAIVAAYFVADRVFERMPHIEDEIAYVWQAEAIAHGHLSVPTPAHPHSFLVPFVVDYNGQRFGKYPISWPAVLAVGVFLGGRAWVNSLLAGLGVWLTYRLGQRLFSPIVGLLAALLTLTSPFFLMNSGSLLSHPFGLVLSAAFALTWLDAWDSTSSRPWLATITSALCLGLLAFTRPLTAVGVAVPFVFHAAILWFRGDWSRRRRLLAFALITMALALLLFVWQLAVTGDPLFNPYTLWWKYDKIGFGPGIGRLKDGHTLHQAWINTKFSLWVGWHDYFGWGRFSWIFLPFGALALLRVRRFKSLPFNLVKNGGSDDPHPAFKDRGYGYLLQMLKDVFPTPAFKALPVMLVFPSLVVVYLAYWIGSSLFGPRYFYEGLYSLTVLSAAGIAWLAGWPLREGDAWPDFAGWWRLRPLLAASALALLLSTNLLFYTPMRLESMYGLYGISRTHMEPFLSAQSQGMTPALVIVHPEVWMEYGTLLELTDPFLDTPFLITISVGEEEDAALAADYPERKIYDYYPDKPWVFFRRPSASP